MSILFSISWFFLTFDFAEITFARQKKGTSFFVMLSLFRNFAHIFFIFY